MQTSHLALDMTLEQDFTGMKEVLSKLRPTWTWEDVSTKPFTTGITNQICGYFHSTDTKWDDMIMVRLYGQNTDLIINRAAERRNMNILHSMGSGPPLYAVLKNALVYGFVQGVPTGVDLIRDPFVRELVAKEMARLHSIDLSLHPDVDVSKPLLFDKTVRFLDLIPEPLSDLEKQKAWDTFGKSLADIRKEFEMMKQVTTGLGCSPCGFTHNDTLLENIIYNKDKGKVSFIDYEYGGYNYLYFDIGNHFAEHAGVENPDHSLFPVRQYRKQWLSIYLAEYNRLVGDNFPVTDAKLEEACNMSGFFALWSHIFWGTWALVQAEHSLVPFDYTAYAISRLGAYFDKKNELLSFLGDSSQ